MANAFLFCFPFILSFLLLCHSLTAFAVPSDINSSHWTHTGECDALLEFSNSFTVSRDDSTFSYSDKPAGISYPKTSLWKKGTDCCLWNGVTCDTSTNRVIALDLSYSRLTGSFHSNNSLFLLPWIQRLNLAGNNFCGSEIPCVFNIFTKMTHLNLSRSKFSGPIPSGIGNLSCLTDLDLGHNNLSGNTLNLHFDGNYSFPRLQILDLSQNSMSGQIPEFWNIGRNTLTDLDLSSNKFRGEIPSWICQLSSLKHLDLSNNYLNGPIPRCLGNQFPGQFPDNIYRNSSLELIALANNNFQGPLPIPPASCRYYIMSRNNFTGDIPSQICLANMLKFLDLSHNKLTGFIPGCFVNLSASLSVLDLGENELVGKIPNMFRPKASLRVLRLSRNRLNGTLPKSFANCMILELLDLSENDFYGGFPDYLGALPNLKVLLLRSNQFHGMLESDNRTNNPFKELHIFDISDNSFYGPLPSRYIANFQSMKNYVGGNPYYIVDKYDEGSIWLVMKGKEIELVKIWSLFIFIDFSSNSFDGEIPRVIGDLKALVGLNLSHNNLVGDIPSSMGNLVNLEWLDLSDNQLQGEIPREIGHLSLLGYLDLSDNHLKGKIPGGTQMDTFRSDSYNDNVGICGRPFLRECGDENQTQETHPSGSNSQEEESGTNIEWKAVLMGYGCGLSIGVSACYIMLGTMRPIWLARMLEKERYRNTRRTKKGVAPRDHCRRSKC